MKQKTRQAVLLFLVFFLAAGIYAVAFLEEDSQQAYSESDKAYYLTADDAAWVRPGLNVNIMNVTIGSDRKAAVTFKLTDDSGQSLDREGKVTPGAVSLGIILAYLPSNVPSNANQYVSYATRPQTSPITGRTEAQAGADSGGVYASVGDGVYTYTLNTVLPSNYDVAATHTLGIYASRNLAEFGLSRYRANVIENFVPNGSPVVNFRELTKTENCNACHDPLMAHGETGREAVEICVLCHTPQTKDPDTGNTLDMKVMTHKIHRGVNLPSVKSGKPYQIIGRNQSVADYSHVVFPMDIRNCTACHKGAEQSFNFLFNPTRDTCGSCHDQINWATGENHPAGPQANDKKCASCHQPDGQSEYNAAIRDAHIPEYKSTQLLNPKLEVLSVTSIAPGQKPTVQFRVTDKNGNVLDPNKMNRVNFTLAGPSTDYKMYITENVLGKATAGADGTYSYAFAAAVPSDATGTYVIEAESYINTTISKLSGDVVQRDVSENVVKPFAVTGTLAPRREVVQTDKCNACHDKIQPHGSNRNTVEACAVCHNPTMTDAASRPAEAKPGDAIDFKVMIHKIHTGEELTNDYALWGRGGAVDFREVRYPGDRRDCLQCHVAGSFTLPRSDTLSAVTTPRGFWTPTQPVTAACLGCHDTIEAAAHALINTATFPNGTITESCVTCHKEGGEASVSKAHAR